MTGLLSIRARLVAAANDVVRRTVRLLAGGESHHPTGAYGSTITTLCGRMLYGPVIWSSGTTPSCKDCARVAKEEDEAGT